MDKFTLFAFLAGFPIMWCVVCLFLSHIGGWAELAEKYRDDTGIDGTAYCMRSGRIGIVNYASCLTLRVSDAGLRLSVLLPFRIGHPPIFIPWIDFHHARKKRALFICLFVKATIGNPPVTDVMLPLWLIDYIRSSTAEG